MFPLGYDPSGWEGILNKVKKVVKFVSTTKNITDHGKVFRDQSFLFRSINKIVVSSHQWPLRYFTTK